MTQASHLPDWRKNGKNALEYLIQGTGDEAFPALSSAISEINHIVASERESAGKLTKAILQDFALTNKLLKLVNTVSYGQFGGKINTISKAVVILGFDTVRNVAMELILLEFLQNRPQANQLHDEVISSFFAGLVAGTLCNSRHIRDTEEVMICAMLHKLGRLLGTFYFFEESQAIAALMAEGMDESRASLKLLGISYDELGQGIARHWGFPDRLLSGMQKMADGPISKPRGELAHLNVTANLANELCELAAGTDPADKDSALQGLALRYKNAVDISEEQLEQALEHGLAEIAVRSTIINLPTAQSPLLKSIAQWNDHAPETESAEDNGMQGIIELGDNGAEAAEDEPARIDPESVLTAGIQDVTNTLVMDFKLNDVLQMVLETMYRAMGFNRIMVLVRDPKTASMRARSGFGRDIDALLPKFHFPLKFMPDVFHIALEKGAMRSTLNPFCSCPLSSIPKRSACSTPTCSPPTA